MTREAAPRGAQAGALRLFVAADIPDDVRADLSARVAALHPLAGGVRWTAPQNWHVTLAFLGSTDLREWVTRRLAEAAATLPQFGTRVRGAGAFPSWNRARVLWAGLADDEGAFVRTARTVGEVLSEEFRPEDRPFAAHLTLARMDPPQRLDGEAIDEALSSREFTVEELVLYRSRLRRPAPVYEALERFPLNGREVPR